MQWLRRLSTHFKCCFTCRHPTRSDVWSTSDLQSAFVVGNFRVRFLVPGLLILIGFLKFLQEIIEIHPSEFISHKLTATLPQMRFCWPSHDGITTRLFSGIDEMLLQKIRIYWSFVPKSWIWCYLRSHLLMTSAVKSATRPFDTLLTLCS
jgi:hypothetical protein